MTPATAPNLQFDEAEHRYSVDGVPVPSVTQIIETMEFIDTSWFTEASRQRGQAVHKATHFIDEDDFDWEDYARRAGAIIPYLRAWVRFKNEMGFEPLSIEQRLISPCGRFAGTYDRVGMMEVPDDPDTLVDIKSGIADERAHHIQVGGYIDLHEAAEGGRIKTAIIVHLGADGRYKMVKVDVEQARALWRATLSLFIYLKKGVIK